MAYDLVYNSIEGQAGLYARVQRLLDGKWWDEASNLWVDEESARCDVALAEDVAIPGKYAGSASFAPANGSLHDVSIYDVNGLLLKNVVVTKSDQITALEIINEVQGQLRLPKSVMITEPHAQLLLSFLNEVQLDYMMEFVPWEELKVDGAISLKQGVARYLLAPMNNVKVDLVKNLQIGSYDPLYQVNDEKFRDYRNLNSSQAQPIVYRHYGRAGGGVIIEVSPVPDKTYRLDFELVQKPVKLVNATDIPILDQDTIILGVKYLAKKDQGDDVQSELAAFQSKLSLQSGAQTDNSGDVEFL